MKTNVLLNNFTAGQLCAWLDGRIDIDGYAKGAKSLLNCVVRPFGGALRRSGSLVVNTTKTTGTTRLIPFAFSVDETYIIEVGIGYFRFYQDGGIVVDEFDVIYELSNTLTEDDVNNFKYTQSNDVMFFAIGSMPVKKLSRVGAADWTWTDLEPEGGPFLLENTTSTTLTPSAITGAITLTASSSIFEEGHEDSYWSVGTSVEIDSVLTQGVVQITGYISPTTVSATVYSELSGTGATEIWSEGAWSDVRGYPKAITFFDKRLWLANTDTEKQKVWGSRPFIYNDFTILESVSTELPSERLNAITSLSSARQLVAFTSGGTFVVTSGSGTEAITSENIYSYQQGRNGASRVQAIKLGDYIYYAQRAGEELIEFKYSWEDDGYISEPVSRFNEDVVESGIKEMTVQENEDNVLWCVLENGKLAAMTRIPSQNVSALSPQETDGEYVSVASIPVDGQFWDDVYTIVRRTINGTVIQYIEIFTKPRKTELETGVFLDCASVYDGYKTTNLTIVSTTATSAGGEFLANDVGDYIKVGDLDIEITAYTSANEVTVEYTGDNIDTDDWAISITSVSGLDYLDEKSVGILRDGSVEPDNTISAGTLELDKFGYYVILGLKYRSEVEPMSMESITKDIGASTGSVKRPVFTTLGLIDTMGIEIEGMEYSEDVFVRKFEVKMGSPNPLYTGVVRVETPNDFDVKASFKIIQENPLPMNLLTITTRVQTQGRG